MKPPVPARYYDPEALDPRKRRDGISAMLRVRDGAQFLRPGLESCMGVFDEIIAVHHQCSDDTPQILHEYAAAYPGRFKVYEYPHEVFPACTKGHAEQGPESPHTIAALCNYALSRTTRRYAVKHDADHLYWPRFAEIADFVRSGRAGNRRVLVSGVNLARTRAGAIGVHRLHPACGTLGDYLFFPVSQGTYYEHRAPYEVLFPSRQFWYIFAGFGFWHLKFLQRHYGVHQCLRRYQPSDYLKKAWGYDEPVPDKRPASGGRDRWRGFLDHYERTLEVISLEEFIALFGGGNSPFLDGCQVRFPRYFARPMMLLTTFPMPARAGVYRKDLTLFLSGRVLPRLLVRSVKRDLHGVSLPSESDLAA